MSLSLLKRYTEIRQQTETICKPLLTEDYVVQPVAEVSPPKWHLGHTAWFFETFILKPYVKNYHEFDADYNYVFNSYYETIGSRVIRTDRGNLSRPTVEDIYKYRSHVDQFMNTFLREAPDASLHELLLLGLHHEQQHQELLYSDIKYILGHNPLFPRYTDHSTEYTTVSANKDFISIDAGLYEIGHQGEGFSFDNELGRHQVYLDAYRINASLVSNGEYLEFIEAGGYRDFRHWHAEGWDWVKANDAKAPLYWHSIEGIWHTYLLNGLQELDHEQPVTHINFYEASAYASFKGMRLPTEAEWEVAATRFNWGARWEWTESAYLPYPGFSKAPGAIGEYNGKFMISQMVLRGASVATSKAHSRITYRNFFHPHLQWQYTGIRLAQ